MTRTVTETGTKNATKTAGIAGMVLTLRETQCKVTTCTDCEKRQAVVATSDGHRFCRVCLSYWQDIGARDEEGRALSEFGTRTERSVGAVDVIATMDDVVGPYAALSMRDRKSSAFVRSVSHT